DPARPLHVRLHRPCAALGALQERHGALPLDGGPLLEAGLSGRGRHREDVGRRKHRALPDGEPRRRRGARPGALRLQRLTLVRGGARRRKTASAAQHAEPSANALGSGAKIVSALSSPAVTAIQRAPGPTTTSVAPPSVSACSPSTRTPSKARSPV